MTTDEERDAIDDWEFMWQSPPVESDVVTRHYFNYDASNRQFQTVIDLCDGTQLILVGRHFLECEEMYDAWIIEQLEKRSEVARHDKNNDD